MVARCDPITQGVIRILLIDDHTPIREGLKRLLSKQPDLRVVGEAADGETGITLARELGPDVVVMDVHMPGIGGVEATRQIIVQNPTIRVVGLMMHREQAVMEQMRASGAAAFLLKDGGPEPLFSAIRGHQDPTAEK